jgi:hypothetical protein
MPGFLGGSTGSSGTGGEITFPKEFIDPVTKLRVSQPENLIDTDFEYGLQPTKWETVELINNTPSFFSKSGDTTIPGITSISTNNGTREITVTTATEHGLAVGIPINVTGTKSVTADGSYVINSIPNTLTFTYLCRDEQIGNNAIEDLYSSIITGEFFQGSQIRIADAEGVTTDAEPISTLTVKTDSTHGFGLNTPFYFLNLNSTISQEFEASNTAAKSFDSSNSATAQTFDGSNTLSTFNIDWSNSATVGGATSTISALNTGADTITVSHGAETFANRPLGTPLYYNLTVAASSGYFFTNPRGVVFLKTTDALNSPVGQSTFQVSDTPDGDVIDIVSNMSGTFQLANQARTFAGNNVSPATETSITIVNDAAKSFDGANDGSLDGLLSRIVTVTSYPGGGLVNATTDSSQANLDYYTGRMVRYSTTGSAASGLTNGTTYFIDTFFQQGSTNTYSFTLRTLPSPAGAALSPTGGSGVQKFTGIAISPDQDMFNIKDHGYVAGDMLRYDPPAGGTNFTTVNNAEQVSYYFVETLFGAHNFKVTDNLTPDGSSAGRAAISAQQILAGNAAAPSGAYWIKPTGYTGDPFQVYCDMTTEGGGWMLVFRMDTNDFGAANRTPRAAGSFLVGDWAGWLYNSKAAVDGAFAGNSTNYALDNGTIAFSPVYFASPFNDVMVIANRDKGRRLGWRHTAQIANMRSVIAQSAAQVFGNTKLFGTNGGDAGYWYPTLDKRSDANTANVFNRGANLWGFKSNSDYHGMYLAASMAGGWPNVPGYSNYQQPSGGWNCAQIGWQATGASTSEQYGQIGGGFGCIDAAGTYHQMSHHVWGWGSGRSPGTWDADRSQTYYGHAVYVR